MDAAVTRFELHVFKASVEREAVELDAAGKFDRGGLRGMLTTNRCGHGAEKGDHGGGEFSAIAVSAVTDRAFVLELCFGGVGLLSGQD